MNPTAESPSSARSGINRAPSRYYRGPYAGGAVFFHLDDAPPQITAPVRPERALSVLGQVIQGFPVDHRIAVESFLHQQSWRLEPAPTSVTAHHGGGSTLRVDFDALGRVSNMSGTVSS